MTAHLSRRTLLGAVPTLAMPMALLPASVVEAAAETPILRLYGQWAPLQAALTEASEATADVLYRHARNIEHRIEDLPVTSLEDLAAKVSALAADENGGEATIPASVVEEARRLLGDPAALAALPIPEPVPMTLQSRPDLSTMEGRISAVCEWFDLTPPALLPGEDRHNSDTVMDWMQTSGVSLDWLVLGDPKGLVFAFRKDELQRRAFQATMRETDPTEARALTEALRMRVHHGAPLEACLEAWRSVVADLHATGDLLSAVAA